MRAKIEEYINSQPNLGIQLDELIKIAFNELDNFDSQEAQDCKTPNSKLLNGYIAASQEKAVNLKIISNLTPDE